MIFVDRMCMPQAIVQGGKHLATNCHITSCSVVWTCTMIPSKVAKVADYSIITQATWTADRSTVLSTCVLPPD